MYGSDEYNRATTLIYTKYQKLYSPLLCTTSTNVNEVKIANNGLVFWKLFWFYRSPERVSKNSRVQNQYPSQSGLEESMNPGKLFQHLSSTVSVKPANFYMEDWAVTNIINKILILSTLFLYAKPTQPPLLMNSGLSLFLYKIKAVIKAVISKSLIQMLFYFTQVSDFFKFL